ncbi:MAG: hypothetical protein HZA23_01005 [Nitrospirae bacterium]|nr:hypothetical protein [Nitrospirota bacterium]
MIQDILSYWEKTLAAAKPEDLKGMLENLMKERKQFDPETEKALVVLHDRYAQKAASGK